MPERFRGEFLTIGRALYKSLYTFYLFHLNKTESTDWK